MKYLKNIFNLFCLLIFCVSTSCLKYHQFLKKEVPQGKDKCDKREVAYNFLRSKRVYDEFRTQAIFHVLWLSDDVRTAYIDDYSSRRGKNRDSCEALLRRQLEENRRWMSFYVIADVRQRNNVLLSEKGSYWTMYVKTFSGEKIEPLSIKEIDLEPEYQSMFAHRFDPFKSTYLVRFPRCDGEEGGEDFSLVISSSKKAVSFEWDKKNNKKHSELLKDEDFYWG
jgi:hypothetical protein